MVHFIIADALTNKPSGRIVAIAYFDHWEVYTPTRTTPFDCSVLNRVLNLCFDCESRDIALTFKHSITNIACILNFSLVTQFWNCTYEDYCLLLIFLLSEFIIPWDSFTGLVASFDTKGNNYSYMTYDRKVDLAVVIAQDLPVISYRLCRQFKWQSKNRCGGRLKSLAHRSHSEY